MLLYAILRILARAAGAAGMVAGAMIEIVVLPRPRPRKTAVGKAMQRMGNAMDQALESVAEKMS